jgi:hypothetical protein
MELIVYPVVYFGWRHRQKRADFAVNARMAAESEARFAL